MADPTVSQLQQQLLELQILHERELREAQTKSWDHERELRVVSDRHERELRLQVQSALEKQHDAEQVEIRRRLDELNHSHERMAAREATTVSRELFDVHLRDFETMRRKLEVLSGQIAVWKGIAAMLGVPGIVALLWTLLAAFNNVTVTGPHGLVP